MDTPRYFITPSGQRWFLDRSITRDNWLTWRHALPAVDTDCITVRYKRLDEPTSRNIIKLAAALAALLDDLQPGGSEDSPWTIHRWWRHRDGAPFAAGSACEFSLKSPAADLLDCSAPRKGLTLVPLFGSVFMAALPGVDHPSVAAESSCSSPARS